MLAQGASIFSVLRDTWAEYSKLSRKKIRKPLQLKDVYNWSLEHQADAVIDARHSRAKTPEKPVSVFLNVRYVTQTYIYISRHHSAMRL